MFDPGYYTERELKDAGFRGIGANVSIAKTCTIVGIENILIGSDVRIDGYCSIIAAGNGYLDIGSYIHIGAYCLLSAGDGIVMEDFSGLSHGVKVYSRTDDYSGRHLTNPMVPEKYLGVTGGEVRLERHALIGSSSVILPRVTIGEGSSVGALSLVTRSLDPWGIYFGTPAKRLRARSKRLLELEADLRQEAAGEKARAAG